MDDGGWAWNVKWQVGPKYSAWWRILKQSQCVWIWKKDNLCYLRPWLKMLQNHCLHVSPENHDEVNSIMVPFKPKYHLEIYMPAKPPKWQIKMWGYRGQSHFLYVFLIKLCKIWWWCYDSNVLKFTSQLSAGKNPKVFTENY